jgi:hypothetical protein
VSRYMECSFQGRLPYTAQLFARYRLDPDSMIMSDLPDPVTRVFIVISLPPSTVCAAVRKLTSVSHTLKCEQFSIIERR